MRTPAHPSVVRRLRELTVVSLAGLSVLAGLVVASELHARAAYTPALHRFVEATEGLDQLHSGMLDQQTGLRGYLGSGDRAFLAPYDAGTSQVLAGVAQLASGLRDPEGERLLTEVQRSAAAWQQTYGAPTAAMAATDLAAASDPALAAGGKVLFDRYRRAHDRLDTHVAGLLPRLQASRDHVRLTLLLAALTLLALVAVVGLHRVAVARRLLDRPVATLAERARAAVDGRRLPEVTEACAELVPLAAAVEDLVRDLAATRDREAVLAARIARTGGVTAVLLDHTRLLATTSDAPAIAATTGESALLLLGGDRVAVWLDSAEGVLLSYTSGARGEPVGVDRQLGGGSAAVHSGPAQRALHFGRVVVDDDGARTRVAAPLVQEGRALGVVEVALAAGRPDTSVLDALHVLLSQGAGALTSARRLARTDELVRRDPLTGLSNRRQLERDLADLRGGSTGDVGLLVLDVDHFKRFNDTQGHQAGDDLLRLLGEVLLAVVRTSDAPGKGDAVYRYGGEEFVVLLRACPPAALAASAERVRETVARRLVVHGVTVSVGAASGATAPLGELFAQADTALYAAKAGGRNRVVVAGTSWLDDADRAADLAAAGPRSATA